MHKQFTALRNKSYNGLSVCVSIPAYNDALSLTQLVETSVAHLTSLQLNFEILIINDGSTDTTFEAINTLRRKYPFIKAVHHEKNYGFGRTLREVFTLPTAEWLLFLPGDHQFPIDNIDRFLLLKDEFDFMIGFRKQRNDRLRRRIYSYWYNLLVSIISGYEVSDVNSIVFFKTEMLKNIELKSETAFVHAELFIRMMQNRARVIEIEVIHRQRQFGFGAGGSLKVILPTVKDLLKFALTKH